LKRKYNGLELKSAAFGVFLNDLLYDFKLKVIIMENFSDIILSAEKVSLRKRIRSLRVSMDSLKNKDTEYYEHHQHLINTFDEMNDLIDNAITESQSIGVGV